MLHRQARDGLGQTAVHVAASRDSVDMMLLLLNYGPDLNAQDANLRTPVMLAASGHTDVLGNQFVEQVATGNQIAPKYSKILLRSRKNPIKGSQRDSHIIIHLCLSLFCRIITDSMCGSFQT